MKQSLVTAVLLAMLALLFAHGPLTAQAPQASRNGASEEEIARLVEALDRGRAAWINGESEVNATAIMSQAPDMFIFPPFGGTRPAMGPALIQAQRQTAAQFKGGTGKIELIKAMSSGDLLVLVLVETNEVNFAGQSSPKPWVLRTTQVFRRDGDKWVRLHRHADPLLKQRTLEETLALY